MTKNSLYSRAKSKAAFDSDFASFAASFALVLAAMAPADAIPGTLRCGGEEEEEEEGEGEANEGYG